MSKEDYYEYHETKHELALGQLETEYTEEYTEDDLKFDEYCDKGCYLCSECPEWGSCPWQ